METDVKWCTYGAWGKEYPRFIGKLEECDGKTGKIRYTENQMYRLEYWDMDYVAVHESLEDAILYMIKNGSDNTVYSIKDGLHFPSDTKNIDWDALRKKELKIHKEKING
jgi:hypothetical protein